MSTADELLSLSPSDPHDEVGRFPTTQASALDDAVDRARKAFPAWRDLGIDARSGILRRFRDLVADRKEELARLITREMGKAIWDARGEAALIPAKVDVTLGDGLRFADTLEAGPGARATYHPRGVLAVLGPFNFPAHLPNGHIVPALACGNTVLFKPSEVTPAVGDWLVRAFHQAGVPEDVLQIAQGAGDVGRRLALHTGVDGVLFTGSWGVGRALQEGTASQPGKLLALEMGGKNAMIVWEDADLDLAVAEAALSIAATTGQRCSCTSRLFVHERVGDRFAARLIRALAGLRVGDPLDEQTFMGPLATEAAHAKVVRMRRLSKNAGAERLLGEDEAITAPWIRPGLTRFASIDQSGEYQREEIFGPEAAIYPVRDLDEAITAVNDSEYGLVASVMTAEKSRYEHCIGRIETGLLNWNKGTIGASGKLPFGGRGKSGNDRPAGITATLYCTVAQAHLENEKPLDPATLPPGMPEPDEWE